MFEPSALAEPLDGYLREVVQTLHAAVSQGMRHAADDAGSAGRQIADCREILAEIMAGDVEAWLG